MGYAIPHNYLNILSLLWIALSRTITITYFITLLLTKLFNINTNYMKKKNLTIVLVNQIKYKLHK